MLNVSESSPAGNAIEAPNVNVVSDPSDDVKQIRNLSVNIVADEASVVPLIQVLYYCTQHW